MPHKKHLTIRFENKHLLLIGLTLVFVLNLINWWITSEKASSLLVSSNILFLITTLILFALFIYIYKSEMFLKNNSELLISLIDSAHDLLSELYKNPLSKKPYINFLENIESLSGACSSAIYLPDEDTDHVKLFVNSNITDPPWPSESPYDTLVLSNGEILVKNGQNTSFNVVYIPIYRGVEFQGQLVFRIPIDLIVTKQVEDTFKLYSKFMANILYISRLTEENIRNVQYDERASIARELHDSIAQSLSYMKIQVSRLQEIISVSALSNDDALVIDNVIQELRTSLNIAYRHLRELMSSYRITLGGRGFKQALNDSIREFSNRSIIDINVDNRIPENLLSVPEEVQLLQIIREGLSNMIRHSQATTAQVSLHYNNNSPISIRIEDNGIGLPKTYNRDRHHGIIIMQERVLALNGNIQFKENLGGGTIVLIKFNTNNQSSD